LVTLALHRQLLVLNIDSLAEQMQCAEEVDARLLDKALESCLYEEVGEYQLMARNPEGWESVLAVVLALDTHHHEFLVGVLERCCHLDSEHIEDNGGLYAVLTSDEMLECDIAGNREDRRARSGYVAPTTAASFLKLARTALDTAYAEHDVVTRTYLRELEKTASRQQLLAARQIVLLRTTTS